MEPATQPPIYGLMAEFATSEALLNATQRANKAGYRQMDAYSPIPVEGVTEAIGFKTRLPWGIFCGGLTGAVFGMGLQYWAAVIYYPMNIGGRPMFSIPSFIPVTFETTVLFSVLTAVFGMIILNKLPMPYHPVFNVQQFARASTDRFFLAIESTDPKFDRQRTWEFLESLKPESLAEVPH